MSRYIDADKLWDNRPQIPKGYNEKWVQGFEHCLRMFSEQIRKQVDNPTDDVAPRAEVASDIFAEIEKEIDRGLSVISKILNTKSGRANGKTVLLSKYDVFIEAKKHLAELKKKYIPQPEVEWSKPGECPIKITPEQFDAIYNDDTED